MKFAFQFAISLSLLVCGSVLAQAPTPQAATQEKVKQQAAPKSPAKEKPQPPSGNTDSTRDDEQIKKQVKDQLAKLADLANNFEFDKARKLMTENGWNSLLVEQVGIASEFSRMSTEDLQAIGLDEALVETLSKICKKHGLDKLKMDQDGVDSMEEAERRYEEFAKEVVKLIPQAKQAAVINEIYRVSSKMDQLMMPSPFNSTISEQKISKDSVVVNLDVDFGDGPDIDDGEFGNMEVEFVAPPVIARFKKQDQAWLWDGIDIELTNQAMEKFMEEGGMDEMMFDFPLIEDLELEGKALSGKKVNIEDYRGKVVLVDFWGTWCQPCVAELPVLKKIRNAFQKHGFEVVGVAADNEKKLKEFTSKKLALPWENIIDGKMSLSRKFNIQAYPTTLLIDKEGNHVKSNLAGLELVDELIKRLNLKSEDFKTLREELQSGEREKDSKPNMRPEDF